MIAAILIAASVGYLLGLVTARALQAAREVDERTERIWQGVKRSMESVRETCRHCGGRHLDTECDDTRSFSETDPECMAVVVRGWPESFASRRSWRERPVA